MHLNNNQLNAHHQKPVDQKPIASFGAYWLVYRSNDAYNDLEDSKQNTSPLLNFVHGATHILVLWSLLHFAMHTLKNFGGTVGFLLSFLGLVLFLMAWHMGALVSCFQIIDNPNRHTNLNQSNLDKPSQNASLHHSPIFVYRFLSGALFGVCVVYWVAYITQKQAIWLMPLNMLVMVLAMIHCVYKLYFLWYKNQLV